jgi:cell division protein FtsI (penicillin-binding protein 3)
MLARTDSRARAVVLLVVLTLVAGVIGFRLVWWQAIARDDLTRMALAQLTQQEELPAERGEIADRNGQLLATSVELQSIFATPPSIDPSERREHARILAAVLGLPESSVYERISSDDPFTWLERRVSPYESDRVRQLDLDGIGMIPETKRFYPVTGAATETTLASQLLGYVDVDGVGRYGVEAAENALLAGRAGQMVAEADVVGRQIADSVYALSEPVDGADLRLTIDAGVQNLLESAIQETYRINSAKGATGIILNAETGAILGMASVPAYDGNAYAATDGDLFANPAIARQYEPGSVMKSFTIAAAIDAGAVTPRDTFEDDNNLVVRGIRIQNADRGTYPYGHGSLRPADVLALSNNVGAAKIGLALGSQGMYDAFRRFGFGSPTGIDLAGEASGLVWHPDQGSGELTTAQNAFGQGLSLTAVQLASGYAAFANGGKLVTPHVVAGWTDADGVYHEARQPPPERVMREDTAETVRDLLINAIENGIAARAGIPGYTVAGKTGTAQIAAPVEVTLPGGEKVLQSQYIDGWVDSSFVGFLPESDPPLVTLILIHRPAGAGGPQMPERPEWVFSELMPQVLDYLAIPPDRSTDPVARP